MAKLGVYEPVVFRYVLCNRVDKFSAHIYGDLVVNRIVMYSIAKFMNNQISDLDMAIYNT